MFMAEKSSYKNVFTTKFVLNEIPQLKKQMKFSQINEILYCTQLSMKNKEYLLNKLSLFTKDKHDFVVAYSDQADSAVIYHSVKTKNMESMTVVGKKQSTNICSYAYSFGERGGFDRSNVVFQTTYVHCVPLFQGQN
jgi:hypothetical protein